jgi:hypothetical protein
MRIGGGATRRRTTGIYERTERTMATKPLDHGCMEKMEQMPAA